MTFLNDKTYTCIPASLHHTEWLYQLYKETMYPVIQQAIGWVEEDQYVRCHGKYTIDQFRLIVVEEKLAGALYTIPKSDHLHLSLILIHAAYRNQSLGTQILQDLKNQQRNGAITLAVFKRNPAIQLYKRLGFHIDAEDEYFYEMSWRS